MAAPLYAPQMMSVLMANFPSLLARRPHDTPFEDGTFKLTLEFTEEYPNKPPTVRFVSKMFHPNGNFTNLFTAFDLPHIFFVSLTHYICVLNVLPH